MSAPTPLPMAFIDAFGDMTIGAHGKALTPPQMVQAYNRLREVVLGHEAGIVVLQATVAQLRTDLDAALDEQGRAGVPAIPETQTEHDGGADEER